ncbi:MAG: SpoIIE family protein phosphatase [Spirochaetota bacterium]
MNRKTENKISSVDLPFRKFLFAIIHEWSITLTALAFTLVPVFFILDFFTMPEELLPRFAFYRIVATAIPVLQYFMVKKTSPGRLSYIHGYLVTIVVGGVIAIMTVDLGGFDSSYYAGMNLVIIGVNLLLPWEPIHSAINGTMMIALYVILNVIASQEFALTNLVNNLFFMFGTVIIAVSINYVRHKLIKDEFHLRAQLREAKDALWGEMELAKKIQTTILPKNTTLGNYQISALMITADEVGGDYYDFFETELGDKWVTIGDVSGHGVDSGLIMMMTQTSIFSILNRTPGCMPSRLFVSVNAAIRKNLARLDSTRYMTLTVIKLCDDKIITAGLHQDIIIQRNNEPVPETISTNGTWIGISDDIENFTTDQEIPVSKGDMILLYTDGASEAKSASDELFGEKRIIESFKRNYHLPLNNIVQNIMNDIKSYQSTQVDDITLVVVKKMA